MVTVCPSQFATRRTLFHVLVGCGLLMLKGRRLKLPVIWLLVSMWLNTLTKSQIWTLLLNFFFQAEDGIRYGHVTGVQTCALPIYDRLRRARQPRREVGGARRSPVRTRN